MKDRSKKTRIVSNAKRVNPTKFDPTRTTTLRRAFVGKLRRKFASLRKAIYDLLVVEDALGLKKNLTYNHIEKLSSGKYRLLSHEGKNLGTFDSHEEAAKHEGEVEYFKHTANSFCPTGPGGGVDPSCSPSDGVSSISSKQEHVMKIDSLSKDREHAMSFDAKTGELLREESGNTGADWSKGENYSVSIPRDLMASKVISHLHTHMDEYSSFSDGDWAVFASKQIKDMTVVDKFNVYTLVKPESYISAERSKYTPRELKEAWEKELYKIESADVKGTKSPGQLIDETNKNLASIYGFQYTSRPKYPTTNERWRFNTTPEQLEAFKEWLKTQVEYYVTGMTDEELWRKFIESGFKKGAGRAFDDTKPQAGWTEAEGAFYAGTKDQFLRSAFGQPESVEKVQLLAARTFEELKGMSADLQTKVGRILVDGLTKGNGPISIAREMSNQLNLSMTRAETIARTELIRAHAEGQLVGMEELGVDEVGVMVEWSTAGDDRVCELCEPMEGVVLKIEEARGMIPRHPNCRCAFVPANVAEPTDDQKRGKRKIMSAVRTSAALGKDDFSTAVPVTKERPKSVLPVIANVFDPDEPRDDSGKWTTGESLVGDKGELIKTDGGRIDVQHVTKFAPRKQSVIDFVVDEDKRGKGIGDKLLKKALSKYEDLGGQVSSAASLKVFHNNGFRHPDLPNGSFEQHLKLFKEEGGSLYMAHKDDNGKAYVTTNKKPLFTFDERSLVEIDRLPKDQQSALAAFSRLLSGAKK